MGNLIREEQPRADGIRHTDTKAIIAGLKAINANTYVYPMAGDDVQWTDLRDEFLPAAAAAGIDVWVLVYSPSQAGCCVSKPFRHDYVAWSREIAKLAASHPNLTGWTVDDYAYDLRTFTPAYLRQMRAAAEAISPDLRFVPTVYYPPVHRRVRRRADPADGRGDLPLPRRAVPRHLLAVEPVAPGAAARPAAARHRDLPDALRLPPEPRRPEAHGVLRRGGHQEGCRARPQR
ncbi:hypothetical protein GCM10020001_023800 [Nonomuraea salmonea]